MLLKILRFQLVRPLFFLLYHGYTARDTFLGTDSAPFAIEEISFKIPLISFVDGHIRAKDITDSAFNAFRFIDNRPQRSPVSGFILAGITGSTYYAAHLQVFPRKLFF
jgi:hypothetical protein